MGAKRRSPVVGQNSLASEILARFGSSEDVTVERLESELAERERYDIVAALRELQKAGAGAWERGRKGSKSRFVWARQLPSPAADEPRRQRVSRAAPTKPASSLAPQPTQAARPTAQDGPPLLEHSFHIRKGALVSLRLPADVTKAEIERLCQFLQAIPFR